MFHVYETLTSDVTSDFSGNVANKFKVKPGLNLPGLRWKVSIHSAVLPKMALFKDFQSETKNLIEMYYKVEGVVTQGKSWIHGSDIRFMESLNKCRTGVDFMNEVKMMLDERRNYYLPVGKKILEANWVNLEWKRESGEPELLLQHSHASTRFNVLKKFAKPMHWINPSNLKDGHLGMNLLFSYPSHTRETSELSNNEVHKMDATWLYLSSKIDFRFVNVNEAFANALNLHARPLIVTATVTTGTGANKVTTDQPLGRVYYAPQGRERYLYSPPLEEVHHLIATQWDEVEIKLTELDGTAVQFQDDSQCRQCRGWPEQHPLKFPLLSSVSIQPSKPHSQKIVPR